MDLTTEQALLQGVAAHKEGKLEEAERLYRAILRSDPGHTDANHNLDVLAVSLNKTEVGFSLNCLFNIQNILDLFFMNTRRNMPYFVVSILYFGLPI